jgi:hypothetical protein
MGWALQMVIAYTVTSIPDVMSSPLGQPWASYLIQVLPQKTALAVLAITICCGFSMGQGCMVAASRVTFAYARDGCFPMSFWIRRVNKTFFVGDRFRRGPWHLGKFSKPIGMVACSFILVMTPILCFPAGRGSDVTLQLMNWTAVVYGGP